MKQLLIILCCLALTVCAGAQTENIDYYKRIAAAKTDSQKAIIYREAMIHYHGKDADSFQHYSDKGLRYFRTNKSALGEGIITAQLGLTDRNEGRNNVALQRLRYALDIFRKENYRPGIADLLGNIGSLEAGRGNFDVAAKYITESLKLEDSLGQKHGVMVGYMNLGSMYLMQNDTLNAGQYLDKAHEASKQLPLSDQVIGLYNMKGILYAMQGHNEQALATFLHNLELTNNTGFIGARVECLSYIGQYYFDNHQSEKAIQYLNDGLKLATEHNMPEIRSNILLTLAAVTQDKDVPATLRYLDEALAIAKELGNKAFMAQVYEAQASYYKDLGRFKEALFANEQKQKINDSIFSINKSIELSSIAATYELEKSNLRVQDLEILSKRNGRQRNILLGVAIGVVVIFVVLLLSYRKTIVLNRQLKQHQDELKELNFMKDKLFSIIGHDLRGPISRIPMILDIYEDAGTSAEEKTYLLNSLRQHAKASTDMLDNLLFWGKSLVKGIPMQQTRVSVNDTTRQNIELKKLALADKGMSVTSDIPVDTYVHADATHFDFIIRNLMSNAIKYGHKGGAIFLSADKISKPGFTIISVKDNGTGISKDRLPHIFNPTYSIPGTADEKGTGIGLMLCKEFAILNGGDIRAESEPGKGATFYLSLKSAV